jgi:MFS family permease
LTNSQEPAHDAAHDAAQEAGRVVWLLGVGIALSLLGDTTLYIVLPTHTAAAGIALTHVGLMLSANRLIRILINGPVGLLVERVPRRWVLITALLIGAGATLLYTVGGFWPLLAGRLLWGVAWSGLWIGANAAVLDVVTGANRGRYVGRFQMWMFIGIGAGSVTGGILTDWLGYNATMVISVFSLLLAAVVWWLFLPETRRTHPRQEAHTAQADSPRRAIFSAPMLLAVALMGVTWLIFGGVLASVMPRLLQERVGDVLPVGAVVIQIATLTGLLMAANMLAGLLSSPLAGWLSDYARNRWGLVVGAMVVGIVALAFIAEGDGRTVVIATTLGAVANSILQTQALTLAGDYAGNRQGRALGVLTTSTDMGATAGPLLAYALLPVIGLAGIFTLAALLLLVLLPPVLLMAHREYRRPVVERAI